MSERKIQPLRLELRREPQLHFYTRIGDVDYVLPLTAEHARTLGACLVLLADVAPEEQKVNRAICLN
jgi:hypothetical protein